MPTKHRQGDRHVSASETQTKARKVVLADIKPENPAERAAHYIDAPNCRGRRRDFPGSRSRCSIPTTMRTTALFEHDPGAIVPLQEHTALEQTL